MAGSAARSCAPCSRRLRPSSGRAGGRQAGERSYRRQQVEQRDERVRPRRWHGPPGPRTNEERHPEHLVEEGRSVLPPPVLAELLPVIRGEDDRSALPLARVERVPELSDFRVRVADLVVVERRQVPDVAVRRARELSNLEAVDLVAGERARIARIEGRLPARPVGRRVRVVRVHEEQEEEEGLAAMRREPLRRVPRCLAARSRDRREVVRRREERREAPGETVAGVERRVGDEGGRGPARSAQILRERGHAGDDAERRSVRALLNGRDASGHERSHRRDRPGGRSVGALGLPGAAEDRVEVRARRVGRAVETERVAPGRVEHQEQDRVRSRIGAHDAQVGEEKRSGWFQPQAQPRSGGRSGELPVFVVELGGTASRGEPPRRASDHSRGAAPRRDEFRDERDVSPPRRRSPGEAQASAGPLRQRPLEGARGPDSLVPHALRVHEHLRRARGGRWPEGRLERVPASRKRQENRDEDHASPARAGHRPSLMQHL